MGDIYFGAVSGGTLVREVPAWIVNTILLGGTAVSLPITEPAGLFVVKQTDGASRSRYVSISASTGPVGPVGPAGPAESGGTGAAAVTTLSADRATPFRVFVHGGVNYYIQIPAGPLDRPSHNEITVLAPKAGLGTTILGIASMVTKAPNPRLGWKQKQP